MKYCVLTTGIVFLLILTGRMARIYPEGVLVLTGPVFLLSSLIAAALCVRAAILLGRNRE